MSLFANSAASRPWPWRYRPLWWWLLWLPLTAAAQFGPDSTTSVDELDSIVAVVGDDIVTRRELNAALERVRDQMRGRDSERLPPPAVLERQVLERLIVEQLQVRAAEQRGISVDDPALNAAVEGIAQRNNMSLSQLRAAVERGGTDFRSYREQIRRELLATRLRQREVDSRVAVSDQEINNELGAGAAAASAGERAQTRERLQRRKTDQEWDLWLRRMRDETYVEIRL